MALCQQVHKHILTIVGVLVFIHHDISKLILIILKHIRIILKKLHCLKKYIIKIQGIICHQLFLVERVYISHLLKPEVPSISIHEPAGRHELILGFGYGGQHLLRRKILFIIVQLLQTFLDDLYLVVRIKYDKILLIAI
ncbi:hypothetical protein SDC9_145957 [bioreactor metagenome]|uniref:Uncharacterized protein n=1 Tax=bioreactor metagenome TaxID=1076179 RepID=A0A645EA08_9ZZZZ